MKTTNPYKVPSGTDEIHYYQADYTTSDSKTVTSPIIPIVFGNSGTPTATTTSGGNSQKGATLFPFYIGELSNQGGTVEAPTNTVPAEITEITAAFTNRDNVDPNAGTGGFTVLNVGRNISPPEGAVLPTDDGAAYFTSTNTRLWSTDTPQAVNWGKGNLNVLRSLSNTTTSGITNTPLGK